MTFLVFCLFATLVAGLVLFFRKKSPPANAPAPPSYFSRWWLPGETIPLLRSSYHQPT